MTDASSPPPDSPPRGARADLSPFGPLAGLLAEETVTDVFVNGVSGVWVDRGDGLEGVPQVFTEAELRTLAVSLVARGGRHLDEACPVVDVRLGEGIRVHAALPPIAHAGTCLSIRVPRVRPPGLTDLLSSGFLTSAQVTELDDLVDRRVNVLVSGAAGSGKTTLLAAILARAPHHDRLVVVEDVAELRIDHPHVVGLQARQPNLEGVGEVDVARLVRESLRMRPDRLVLGECRGAEVRDLLAALNTGHDGGAGTIHANSLTDVPTRLEALGALAGLTPSALARQAVSAIGVVLHVERTRSGRRLAEMGRLGLDGRGRLRVQS